MRTGKTQIERQSNAGSRGKRTSIGIKNLGTSTMNKSKRRMRGKSIYRGQGRGVKEKKLLLVHQSDLHRRLLMI